MNNKLLLFLFFFNQSFSQSLNFSKEEIVIKNIKTDKHIGLPHYNSGPSKANKYFFIPLWDIKKKQNLYEISLTSEDINTLNDFYIQLKETILSENYFEHSCNWIRLNQTKGVCLKGYNSLKERSIVLLLFEESKVAKIKITCRDTAINIEKNIDSIISSIYIVPDTFIVSNYYKKLQKKYRVHTTNPSFKIKSNLTRLKLIEQEDRDPNYTLDGKSSIMWYEPSYKVSLSNRIYGRNQLEQTTKNDCENILSSVLSPYIKYIKKKEIIFTEDTDDYSEQVVNIILDEQKILVFVRAIKNKDFNFISCVGITNTEQDLYLKEFKQLSNSVKLK